MKLLSVVALMLTVTTASAAEVTVSDAWMRALPSNLPAGGYFTLHNAGKKAVTLVGASSADCGMLMLHKSENMGGLMHMQDVPKVEVPAGGTVSFAPGGYHLMCMNPSAKVKPGKTIDVTFSFVDGSAVKAPFAVRTAAGQ